MMTTALLLPAIGLLSGTCTTPPEGFTRQSIEGAWSNPVGVVERHDDRLGRLHEVLQVLADHSGTGARSPPRKTIEPSSTKSAPRGC